MFARAAFADVTPKNRPVALAGYTARQSPVTKVLDPIEVSALLLETAEQRCLLLSFDLMLVGSELQDRILSKLAAHGFTRDDVVLLASHTHSAPATDQACARLGLPDELFIDDAAEAVDALIARLLHEAPAKVRLEIFQGRLDHAINRRRLWPYPTIGRMHGFRPRGITVSPNPSGPKDETATVAILRATDSAQVLAVLWHYACHATAVPALDVISADFPGVARQALRRQFGDVSCIFLQGFCGNVRPNIRPSAKMGLRDRLRRTIRVLSSGPLFPEPSLADWQAWSNGLATRLCEIAGGAPVKAVAPTRVERASASIPLTRVFTGSTPDKELDIRLVRIGGDLEIVALSAEATVEWQRVLDASAPAAPNSIRLYTGYIGTLFGYLPTAAQVVEGGYEVEGFQPLFGLSGRFEVGQIEPAVTSCLKQAQESLERQPCKSTAG